MTNNPRKVAALEELGFTVVERVPIELPPTEHNQRYLRTKRDKLGHLILLQELTAIRSEAERGGNA
ncbi:Riboflavin biosynthesis protein [bacterium HR27]|nr:Riboflavin biosynthesis protein [bacterium HR27]